MTTQNYVQVGRDPFARTTLVRRVVRAVRPVDHPIECTNCGQKFTRLFQYGTELDGIRKSYCGPHWHYGDFCSKSCHDSYHS